MTRLLKKDVNKACVWWWATSHLTYNYQRLQAGSLCSMMGPLLEKMYDGDQDKVTDGLIRHMQYFNTEPRWGAIIPGMVVALEEGLANEPNNEVDAGMITDLKSAMMGPLAGIGDTVWAGLIKPIILSILLSYAMEGQIWAAWVWGLGVTALDFAVTWMMFQQGYKLGINSLDRFLEGGFIAKVTTFLGIVGLFCLGAMIVKYVTVNAIYTIVTPTGTEINIGELCTRIFPSFVPLLLTYLAYRMLVKGKKITTVLIVLFAVAFIGGAVGFLG